MVSSCPRVALDKSTYLGFAALNVSLEVGLQALTVERGKSLKTSDSDTFQIEFLGLQNTQLQEGQEGAVGPRRTGGRMHVQKKRKKTIASTPTILNTLRAGTSFAGALTLGFSPSSFSLSGSRS